MAIEPPESVRRLFTDAGWYPARKMPVPARIPTGHPAEVVLERFGGLTVGRCGAGEECATSDVAFRDLGPADPDVLSWSELLGTPLAGVAEVHHSHGELYVGGCGRYFGRSCIHDAFYFEGASFGEAVERLLLGRRSRPILRPGRQSVTLYGIRYTADHPDVYR